MHGVGLLRDVRERGEGERVGCVVHGRWIGHGGGELWSCMAAGFCRCVECVKMKGGAVKLSCICVVVYVVLSLSPSRERERVSASLLLLLCILHVCLSL